MIDRKYFTAFHNATAEAARLAFEYIAKKHKPERVCGFCMYSDDDAQSLVTSAVTSEALDVPQNLFYVNSWPYSADESGCLKKAYAAQAAIWKEVKQQYDHLHDEDPDSYWSGWTQHRLKVIETIVSAMQTAAENGAFGNQKARDSVFICFDITDSELAQESFEAWAKRLNTPKMFAEFLRTKS